MQRILLQTSLYDAWVKKMWVCRASEACCVSFLTLNLTSCFHQKSKEARPHNAFSINRFLPVTVWPRSLHALWTSIIISIEKVLLVSEWQLSDSMTLIESLFHTNVSLKIIENHSLLRTDKLIIKKASKERNSNLIKLLSISLSPWCSAAVSLLEALLLKSAGIYWAGSALLNFLSRNNGFFLLSLNWQECRKHKYLVFWWNEKYLRNSNQSCTVNQESEIIKTRHINLL